MKFIPKLFAFTLVLPLIGGGFYLELGTPSASHDPGARDAVVLVQFIGCHQPEKGVLTASAEGIVEGQRRTVAVKAKPLAKPGLYAIERQWPAEGKWVLRLEGKHPTVPVLTTTLVKLTADGFERKGMVMRAGEVGADAMESLLR